MAKWTDVGTAGDLAPGTKAIVGEDQKLVLCHIDDAWYAVQNVCPHASMPIGEGELNGCVLTCPFHGYAYNVETGKNVDFDDDFPLRTYPVKVEADRLLVDVEAGGVEPGQSR